MANEMVPAQRPIQTRDTDNASSTARRYGDDAVSPDEWDIPPSLDQLRAWGEHDHAHTLDPNRGTARRRQRSSGAAVAERDAAVARKRGDLSFAAVREEDAHDLLQTGWGGGSARTWLWIAAMSIGFLLFVALVYFLPAGRDAIQKPISVY